MMIAHGGIGFAWVGIAAAGIVGVLSWASQHPKAGRLLGAVLVACAVGAGVAWANPWPAGWCDPYWAQFWLCIP